MEDSVNRQRHPVITQNSLINQVRAHMTIARTVFCLSLAATLFCAFGFAAEHIAGTACALVLRGTSHCRNCDFSVRHLSRHGLVFLRSALVSTSRFVRGSRGMDRSSLTLARTDGWSSGLAFWLLTPRRSVVRSSALDAGASLRHTFLRHGIRSGLHLPFVCLWGGGRQRGVCALTVQREGRRATSDARPLIREPLELSHYLRS